MPRETDRFDGDHCFIVTMPSRGKFHLYGKDPQQIKIRDIANATSKQCRWTGHLLEDAFYSVAEHGENVSQLLMMMGAVRSIQFQGLMHDTPEAYLSDINAPMKREIGQYYEKEALIWKRIAAKYHLPEVLDPLVKKADWLSLFIEASIFVLPEHVELMQDWVGFKEHWDDAMALKKDALMFGCFQGVDHTKARKQFLERFTELWFDR
jgi:5'-deoxynucleotidase YfbR-like HD superfamily hydrolase